MVTAGLVKIVRFEHCHQQCQPAGDGHDREHPRGARGLGERLARGASQRGSDQRRGDQPGERLGLVPAGAAVSTIA